ncbi:hypothetical protein GWI33_021962 [Rhynchophorus ferrugineus]|uniref:Uncharacterized protein n=1 Tax=Rhynchophorus ferrugineus TaxID=354439 RepID=A0A834IP45_RHYFE|nr:hypothetical protein GWI33_021962 [Rhynchophorus ferrugineus]
MVIPRKSGRTLITEGLGPARLRPPSLAAPTPTTPRSPKGGGHHWELGKGSPDPAIPQGVCFRNPVF